MDRHLIWGSSDFILGIGQKGLKVRSVDMILECHRPNLAFVNDLCRDLGVFQVVRRYVSSSPISHMQPE